MNPDVFEKKCPQCGEKISGNEPICPKCGAPLKDTTVICAKCGKGAPGSAKFCPECGHALIGEESGKKRAGQETEKKKLEFWIPTIPLIILISLCLIVVVLGIRNTPPSLLASELETVVAVGKPTQTPTAAPTATATSTPTTTATPTSTPAPMPPADATLKATWTSPVDGMALVYIPQGQYLIGALDSDPQAWVDEKPQHKVDLSGYWMDKTEVTNAMYAKCVQAGACPAKKMDISYTRDSYYGNVEFDNYPVIYVTWDDAQTYCAWAGRKLPTEAQWEVAARGSDGRKYPWGNSSPSCDLLNYTVTLSTNFGLSDSCTGDTTAVGKYPQGASPYGILDMAGNVWEWVADWKGPNYLVEPHQDPLGPPNGESRVIRGGFYFNDAKYVRATMRLGHDPDDATDYIGFRCAR